MSSLDSWLLIGVVVSSLWGLWILMQFVFDRIEDYHAAWREAAQANRERGD